MRQEMLSARGFRLKYQCDTSTTNVSVSNSFFGLVI
jgi:hypothetical protein